MEEKNNPLSPHLQIYRWQISSLLSITHRIVGVINILAITIICLWSLSLLLGAESYLIINNFLQSFFGKFVAIGLCWTFSFHILNELRHLFWDLGFRFKSFKDYWSPCFIRIICFYNFILFNWKNYFLICMFLQKNGYSRK
jgi:succinate dehydrogenase / fumarate reductase cytochrome b subunit